MAEEIPDKNIFMMCKALNKAALLTMPNDFSIRTCRRDELDIWRKMPFDNPIEAKEYEGFMKDFYKTTYGANEDLFFQKTLFVCNRSDEPIGTCFVWKAYGIFNTIQWLKVKKGYEGLGIGRALMSFILKELKAEDYPIYLHTQPGSYRAIKLYSDFGFYLLSDKVIGNRENDLEECLLILEQYMPKKDFKNLKIGKAPKYFIDKLKEFDTIEF